MESMEVSNREWKFSSVWNRIVKNFLCQIRKHQLYQCQIRNFLIIISRVLLTTHVQLPSRTQGLQQVNDKKDGWMCIIFLFSCYKSAKPDGGGDCTPSHRAPPTRPMVQQKPSCLSCNHLFLTECIRLQLSWKSLSW